MADALTHIGQWRLPWPFRLLVAGSSGSGKTTLVTKVLANACESMSRVPSRVILHYSHMQEAYRKLERIAPCPVTLIQGGPDSDLKTESGTLLLIDDLQASHAEDVAAWFTRKSHHMDTAVIYLVQNLFDKTPHNRTISLNSTHIVLFRNPRDASQVTHLDKQVFPGLGGLLSEVYRMATDSSPHSYIVLDFNQATPSPFRLRNTLLPLTDYPNAYCYLTEELYNSL